MFQRPRGTRDFTPEQMELRRGVEDTLREVARRFGYGEVATPTFEDVELFQARSGSDITDEMYAFEDKGGRKLVLRPELTTPVMRFYANELQNRPKPLKLFYYANTFRYERPQAGRYREFWHFGVELIGPGEPLADAELIALASSALNELGIMDYRIRIGHLHILRSFFSKALPNSDKEHREPIMRLIDKKDIDGLREILHGKMNAEDIEALVSVIGISGERSQVFENARKAGLMDDGSLERLEIICNRLERFGVKDYTLDLGIARGLDYYDGMVFEIDVESLGAEKQVCGGGRYSLASVVGANEISSCGFAFGFDRLVLALEKQGRTVEGEGPDIFFIPVGKDAVTESLELVQSLRDQGYSVILDLMDRSISKNMKQADQMGAKRVMILGDDELSSGQITIKDMSSGDQSKITIKEIKKGYKM